MGCPKNPQKWWIFNSEGPHTVLKVYVQKWAFGKWEITAYCEKCGDRFNRFALEPSDLIRAGLEPVEGSVSVDELPAHLF
jgi:hypothetical protein